MVGAGIVAGLVLVTGTAGAHVTVRPSSVTQGSFDVISFSVPNEKDDANTVELVVELPAKHPVASVSVQPKPGWTVTAEKTALSKPVRRGGTSISEAVSTVTWTATAGGLEPGQFDLFTISAGPMPTNTRKLTFKTLQTYSDGETVSWIQSSVKGAPEPEHPAPTLTLTKAASGDDHHD